MADTPTTAAKAADAATNVVNNAGKPHEPFLKVLASNPVDAWIVSGIVLVSLILVVQVIRLVIVRKFDAIARRTTRKWDDLLVDILKKIRLWLILPAIVEIAAQPLVLPELMAKTLRLLTVLGLGIQLLMMAGKIVDAGLEAMARRTNAGESKAELDSTIASSLGVARAVCMGIIALVVILFALDNLGVKITPMLTGLGIGGIAVALAVQNILGDLFGSLTIILDKPFVVGDFIASGNLMGTVERIGIKTTRVRALSGEQLIFANSDLLGSRIQNFKRMQERRVLFTLGVTYETPLEKVRELPAIIRAAIEKNPKVRVDRCHFKGFGAYSLDFETVYFVLSSEYNVYMDIQQAVNLDLLARFADEGIEFAYPTQLSIHRGEDPALESAAEKGAVQIVKSGVCAGGADSGGK